jgi:hypothetical protein
MVRDQINYSQWFYHESVKPPAMQGSKAMRFRRGRLLVVAGRLLND